MGTALLEKGVGIGMITAPIICGVGMSTPEVSVLASILKPKLMVVRKTTILTIAVVVGYTFSALF